MDLFSIIQRELDAKTTQLYKIREYLFDKGLLVEYGTQNSDESFQTLFALARNFDIEIANGKQYACMEHLSFVGDRIGKDVPEPFYKGFPESVRELSYDQLLFDQLIHYYRTYGMGDFSTAGESIFERDFKRVVFDEKTEPKKFTILNYDQTKATCLNIVNDLTASSRPLNERQYDFIKSCIIYYDFEITTCACKDTAIRLLIDFGDYRYADFITLFDVIRLVEELNYRLYGNPDVKRLSLINKHRKLIAQILDLKLQGDCDYRDCFEKQAVWCGLLHHIHYKPKTSIGEKFVHAMRNEKNQSVYSVFEKKLNDGLPVQAAELLIKEKGQGAFLRNVNYILSRCNDEQIEKIISLCATDNVIILLQLYIYYSNYYKNATRYFKFVKFNKLKVHAETEDEVKKRKSFLSVSVVLKMKNVIEQNLKRTLKNRLGKVYIDPKMKKIALPLQESASMGGLGALPKGSKIEIEKGKKIRAFTYWEKVDDIDLSVIGLSESGDSLEFSWRTMSKRQSDCITYSGDQTSGFYGGSEYFDVNVEKFAKRYPEIRYLVFCDNVFSCNTFNNVVCRGGYMLRDLNDTGEVFEPKTVKTSFAVNCKDTAAYLFAIDLKTNEFIWLNLGKSSGEHIAAQESHEFLFDYMNVTESVNVYTFFEMLATKIVDLPNDADVVVSDEEFDKREDQIQIRSNDFEKMLKIMND